MIVLTDEKIPVTMKMLEQANMARHGQIGVPVDLNDLAKGLRWLDMSQLQNDDYDTLEEYFLQKQSAPIPSLP
ncbi:MAG: hypothetical protein ACRYFX_18740 [Janthinobacterium lividum]